MKRLRIELGERSYEILIGQNILPRCGEFAAAAAGVTRAVVVTHPGIRRLYGDTVMDSLTRAGFRVHCVETPEGEDHKSLAAAEEIIGRLLELGCDRRSVLVALGGGVIGDLTGFVAATFMRGVPFIQAPTTLLAQVDSSVGGKTAVNHRLGKNMIGAFYQPRLVIIDLATLRTLPEDEFRAGLAEIVKYGVIADAGLFAYLETHAGDIQRQEAGALQHIVETSCAIKAGVVEKDETESRHRMILNFGHTLGHAIEAVTGYTRYKHGEAVALGMIYAGRLSCELGLCSAAVCDRILELVKKFALPWRLPELPADALIESMSHDKKAETRRIRFVLAKEIGKVEIADQIEENVLRKTLAGCWRS